MGKFTQCIRQAILKLDLFPATQFLRYRHEDEHKTIIGGLVSAAIIILFIIIFYSLGIQTLNKQIINSSIIYQSEAQPQKITINFKEDSDFMFAFGIIGLNLSDTTVKYFNITLNQLFFNADLLQLIQTNIALVQCTQSHFSHSPETLKFYNDFQVSSMLCPPLNYDFSVGGKLSSRQFQFFSIDIRYCNNTIDPICANDSQLLQFRTSNSFFPIMTPIVNTLVNPGESNYKKVYIEDRNYYYFTTSQGLQLNAQIQQYQIDTDVSLMPWSNIQSQFINTIPNLMQVKNVPVVDDIYVKVKFLKSSISTTFTRSFNKIDNYFSFVGGLAGSIIILFFILQSYSEQSYLVSIASQLYDLANNPPKEFNFLYFISTNIQKVIEVFGVKLKWEDSNKFLQAIDEMEKQLSIDFLLKKINYIQEAINSILNQHQIKALYLTNKKSITTVKTQRKQNIFTQKRLKSSKIQNSSLQHNPNQPTNQNDLSRQSMGIVAIPQQLSVQESHGSQQQSRKQEKQRIFIASIDKVIQQSKSGNAISRRILSKMSKRVYPYNQTLDNKTSKIEIEMKQQREKQLDNAECSPSQKKDSFMDFQFQEGLNEFPQ